MELAIGQFTGRGVIGAIGQCCPLFKGMRSISVKNAEILNDFHVQMHLNKAGVNSNPLNPYDKKLLVVHNFVI